MGRRVLGNDPFQRGAAQRAPEGTAGAGAPTSSEEVPATQLPAPSQPDQGPAPKRNPRGQLPRRRPTPAPPRAESARPPAIDPVHRGPIPPGRSTAPPQPGKSARALDADRRSGTGPSSSPVEQTTIAPPRAPPPSLPDKAPSPSPEKPSSTDWIHPTPPPGLPGVDVAGVLGALKNAPGLLAELWAALEAGSRALRAGLGSTGDEQLDIYGRDSRLSEAVGPLVEFLYSRWFRVEVEGSENVPSGGALLVANHSGAFPLDGPMLQEALRRERRDLPEARWLAEDQVFYAPLLGTLFNRLGAVRASPDSACRLLSEGRPVCIFPEGIQGIAKPFAERYRLKRFGRGGFVKLALRTGKPILPVAIVGAEESLPLLGKLPGQFLGLPYLPVTPLGPIPLPAKWHLRIGRPLPVPQGARDTDLAAVESMVDATRTTIEHMLKELLEARRSVFLG
jgi:1-acyl-sn-glycerol-3-phosphate acyltransferase